MKYNRAWRKARARAKARKVMHLHYELATVMFKAGIFGTKPHKPNWSRPKEVIDLITRPLRFSKDNSYQIARSRDAGFMKQDANKHDKNHTTVVDAQGNRHVLDSISLNVKHMNQCLYQPYKPHRCSSLSHTHNHR